MAPTTAEVTRTKTATRLTIPQQRVENWINDMIADGNQGVLLGLVGKENSKLGIGQLEDFRVKIESDAALAARIGPEDYDKFRAFQEAEKVDKIGEKPVKEVHTEDEDAMQALLLELGMEDDC